MNASSLAAAGYGEFDPVVPNDNPEHRTQNRRMGIASSNRIHAGPGGLAVEAHQRGR